MFGCTPYNTTSPAELALAESQWHHKTLEEAKNNANELTRRIEPNMTMQEVAKIAEDINSFRHPNGEPTESKSEIKNGKKIDILEYWYYHVALILIFDDNKLVETDRRQLRTAQGYVN